METKFRMTEYHTSANLRDKLAFNPFLVGLFFSIGIKRALKAPGIDSNRDLSIPKVRIYIEMKIL